MSVKIRVSYQENEELQQVLKLLRPVIKSTKVKKEQQGPFKKAYIDISTE